jgi:hypothetical protein
MRFLFWMTIVALGVGVVPNLRNEVASFFVPAPDPRVEAAVELRCADEIAGLRDECARELRHDFEAGMREPETIVRRHCTRVVSDWAMDIPRPLPICDELYGGWIRG